MKKKDMKPIIKAIKLSQEKKKEKTNSMTPGGGGGGNYCSDIC